MKPQIVILLTIFVSIASAQIQPYKRSSLYLIMMEDTSNKFNDNIKKVYSSLEFPDKFNNHNLEQRIMNVKVKMTNFETDEGKQLLAIANYLEDNHVARKLVAKWFNRNEKGQFNMKMVANRGAYNATEMDINTALKSKRGMAAIEDAGEELIKNTFVVVSEFAFVHDSIIEAQKRERQKNNQKYSNIVNNVNIGGNTALNTINKAAKTANNSYNKSGTKESLTDGYHVTATSYLFRLNWNDSASAVFYNQHWTDSSNFDPKKVAAFDTSDAYTLTYIGQEKAKDHYSSLKILNKPKSELIEGATKNGFGSVFRKLQHKHDVFKTKTPLLTTHPLTAKIGKKESVKGLNLFFVLEPTITQSGRTKYVKKGIIMPKWRKIWDNRIATTDSTKISSTHFRGVGKKFYPGMFIRQF